MRANAGDYVPGSCAARLAFADARACACVTDSVTVSYFCAAAIAFEASKLCAAAIAFAQMLSRSTRKPLA